MAARRLATVAAGTAVLNIIGLVWPEMTGRVVGLELDAAGVALIRLACASYLALGLLNWMARRVTDPLAWRAIARSNAFGLVARPVAYGRRRGLIRLEMGRDFAFTAG